MRLFLFTLLLPLASHAQISKGPRHATVFDWTVAAGPDLHYGSAAGWQLWGLDGGGRVQAGLGGRVTYYRSAGNDFDHQNGAPAILHVDEPRLLALNLALHLRARVAGPLRLGFNLDLLGATFGPDRTGTLTPAPTAGTFQGPPRPVWNNVLLGAAADRGSLNSALYASVALPYRLSVRGGWSHVVTAYEIGFARYRRARNLAALGLSYQLP